MVVELDRTLGSLHNPGHSHSKLTLSIMNERCISVSGHWSVSLLHLIYMLYDGSCDRFFNFLKSLKLPTVGTICSRKLTKNSSTKSRNFTDVCMMRDKFVFPPYKSGPLSSGVHVFRCTALYQKLKQP